MEFKANKFYTKKDKELSFKQFKAFINSGFKRNKFTNRVYRELHLHLGFIAHYSINGFYETYFNGNSKDFKMFVDNIKLQYEGDYESTDIVKAYKQEINNNPLVEKHYNKLENKNKELSKEIGKRLLSGEITLDEIL